MQVSVLASGSKGNSIFIEMDGTRVLVDAGISARRIRKSLEELAVDVSSLDGIFITHEHRDHIGGLRTLSRQYHLPIYTRQDTFQSMYCVDELPADCFHEVGDGLQLGRVRIQPFNIPHDAADPVGYMLLGSSKCTVATDLGFVTSIENELVNFAGAFLNRIQREVTWTPREAAPSAPAAPRRPAAPERF